MPSTEKRTKVHIFLQMHYLEDRRKDREMARVPQQKRSEETRKKIIAAGMRLFSRDGYHGTSSKKIAADAGVAIGSFYNYFADKKALLLAVHGQHMQRVHDLIAQRVSEVDLGATGEDGRAVVRAIVDQAIVLHDFSPELHRELAALAYTDPDFAAMQRSEESRTTHMLMWLLEPHREILRVDDLEASAWIVVLSMEAVIHSMKMFEPPIAEERLRAVLADMVHRLLYR